MRPYGLQPAPNLYLIPETGCWTETLATLTVPGRQKSLWHHGALQIIFERPWDMAFSPRYG